MPLDRLVYSKLLEILELSERGDTETQKYVHENLAIFEQNRKDVSLYYLEASLGANSFHSKQMALLLLKKSILQSWNQTELGIQNLIKSEIIKIVNLKEPQLRNVVASCYVTIFNVEGYQNWPYGIENLLGIISNYNDDFVVETATVTLIMILEDSLAPGYPMSPPYLNYLKSTFVTNLFQVAAKSDGATELVSRIMLVLLDSNLILEYLVGEMFNPFWNLLGRMATQDNYNVKKCVLKGMLKVWDFAPLSILQSSEAIFPFITKLCSDDAYTIQIDALDFYTHILQSQLYPIGNHSSVDEIRNMLLTKMNKEFPMLLKILVDNTRYSSWDYMSMDRTHLEDDNANIPDDMQDVPIKTREDEDTNTWGNTWTVRKGSALLLDTISQLYGHNNSHVIKVLLGYIQEKLDSSDWELKESGVLTLGAISKGSLYSLFPYLPKVVDYLIQVARDRKPLLRIISCWCLSRFVEWIVMPENSRNYLERSLMTILECMLDRNKRVQESACSSFTSFEETGATQLAPYVGRIMQVLIKCLGVYQARNFMILYDVIGTLYQNVGEHVAADANHLVLVDLLLKKMESTPTSETQFVPLVESLSSVVTNLGNRLPVVFVEKLTKASVLSLYQLLSDDVEMNNQVVEVLSDNISVLITSSSTFEGAPECRGGYDMTSVVLSVLNSLKVTNNVDIVRVITELCDYKIINVLQSCIALLGDLCNNKVPLTEQALAMLVATVQYYLGGGSHGASINSTATTSLETSRYNSIQSTYHAEQGEPEDYFGVLNNCIWVFGVVCDHQVALYSGANLDAVFMLVVRIFNLCASNLCVLQNCSVTVGKFAVHFPNIALRYLNAFLNPLCQHLIYSKNDSEKLRTVMAVSNVFLLYLQQTPQIDHSGGLVSSPNTIRLGVEEIDCCNVVLLFRLYTSITKGSMDTFGDSFGSNSELLKVAASVIKSLVKLYPKLQDFIDMVTKQEIQQLLQYS
ncbi:importin beta/transportin [Theileria orientalis strain Shintoku]|uniref:Importin beta/transportin n=1 Tax=Theileria orientalis strain Shintoku TaxID=869250 RepID=J7M4M9_THEOR|nr:importin beta/transportin [Theileria orientalis strain Shintoku]PVC53093.1 importin beta/transportin [Theileria orientalis]BAM42315.1 importin beta/transportin [Theileria orientalis strain Shintoku]|eukprot:XP_009692616.1 importin beta/transportin [Theileria orientalis strain Shintoku]